jgi:hypothetical protein
MDIPAVICWVDCNVTWCKVPTLTRGRRREHYQWNMDIVGVEGVEAEAELLAAITTFFARLGITSKDVGIKVSSRKVGWPLPGVSLVIHGPCRLSSSTGVLVVTPG